MLLTESVLLQATVCLWVQSDSGARLSPISGDLQALPDFRSLPAVMLTQSNSRGSKKPLRSGRKSKGLAPRCDTYEQYEQLLERKDIDVVEVVTPDHWHALMTIHACQAGKDVYVQKPLSYTIREALTMTRVANDNKRVVQVGSQQRSSKEFQKAIELVQKGAIGHIEKIYAKVGDPPKPLDLPEMPIPGNLNWNLWLGPLNDDKIKYNSDLAPQITLDPVQNETLWGAWRWYLETGNGYTADWGAHMFDIAQAAIGMDGSAPCEIIPKGYNGQPYMTYIYKTGVVMTEQPYLEDNPGAQGIKFIGTKGWIEVARGYIACSDASLIPADIAGNRPQPRAERPAGAPQGQRPPAAQGRQGAGRTGPGTSCSHTGRSAVRDQFTSYAELHRCRAFTSETNRIDRGWMQYCNNLLPRKYCK